MKHNPCVESISIKVGNRVSKKKEKAISDLFCSRLLLLVALGHK